LKNKFYLKNLFQLYFENSSNCRGVKIPTALHSLIKLGKTVLSNHGYGINPIKDMKNTVLPNLISECNAVGIFTPRQLDEFSKYN
jgi:hypothetical protein